MTVYGRTRFEIPLNKGTSFSPDYATSVPDGHLINCQNLVFSPNGDISPRGSFKLVASWTVDTQTVAQQFGYWTTSGYLPDASYTQRAFELVNPEDDPGIFTSGNSFNPNMDFHMINAQLPTAGHFVKGEGTVVGAKRIYAMCQYNDRTYFVNGTGVGRITAVGNFNGTSGTLTSVAVDSSIVNTYKATAMLSLNDRIFLAMENKIYFTEVALPGGYPENWNNGNNFITVVGERGKSLVNNMFAMDGRLYLFTDKGIYYLYCNGPQSTWTLKLITPDISVFSPNGVCKVGQSFVVTDRKKLFVFNGSTYREFGSQELEETFKNNNINVVEVFPFEHGVLIQFALGQVLSGATPFSFLTIEWYYFDGEKFSLFTPPWTEPFSTPIAATFVSKYSGYDNDTPTTYIVNRKGCWAYIPNDYTGDQNEAGALSAINFDLTSKTYDLPVYKIKKAFYGYAKIGMHRSMDSQVAVTFIRDPDIITGSLLVYPAGILKDTSDLTQKCSILGYFERIYVTFGGAVPTTYSNSPRRPFVIFGVYLEVETDFADQLDKSAFSDG